MAGYINTIGATYYTKAFTVELLRMFLVAIAIWPCLKNQNNGMAFEYTSSTINTKMVKILQHN